LQVQFQKGVDLAEGQFLVGGDALDVAGAHDGDDLLPVVDAPQLGGQAQAGGGGAGVGGGRGRGGGGPAGGGHPGGCGGGAGGGDGEGAVDALHGGGQVLLPAGLTQVEGGGGGGPGRPPGGRLLGVVDADDLARPRPGVHLLGGPRRLLRRRGRVLVLDALRL